MTEKKLGSSKTRASQEQQEEETLWKGERRYRLLFDNMTTAFALHEMLYDEQGNPVDYRFLDANKAFGQLTGLSVASILGRTVLEVLPGTERHWIETYAKVVQNGTSVLFEDYSAALGKWFEVRAFRTAGKQFATVFTDVSERKRLETEVQDAREYVLNIAETVREPLLVLSPELKVLVANRAFYDTFKGTPQATVGTFIYDLGNGQWDIPELRVLLEKILPDQTVFNGYEVKHDFPEIGRKTMVLNARQIYRKEIGSHLILLALEDITERKRAEEALGERENDYRLLVENSHDIIYTLDSSGVFTFVSPSWKEMLGQENDAVVGHRFQEFVHPDDVARCEELVAFALQTREPVPSIEYRVRNVQGEWRWHNSNATRIINGDGTCSSVVAIASDVTDRKRAEEELRESKELLGETEKTAHIGGWVLDAEKLTQKWTEETFRILEIDVTKGEPKVPEGVDFIAPAFRPMAEQGIRRAIEFGEPYDQEWEVITVKGNRRWVHAVARAYQEQGKTKRVSGSFQDITGRKEMEEGLRESHERFQLANRATFDTIWDWNLQTNALWWNENLRKVFNYSAEEIEPTIESWTSRMHPEDVDRISTSVHAAIDSGQQSWSDHYRFRRKDGSFAEIEDRGYVSRDVNGKPVRMIGAMQDITERKRAEDALAQNAKLLNEVQEVSHIGGWMYDAQTKHVTWTREVYGIHELPLEYDPNDVANDIQFYSGDDRKLMEEAFRRAATVGEPYDLELQFVTAKGNHRWVRTIGVPELKDGHVARIVGNIGDITERKQTETQLRQSYKMTVVGELAGGVAHDFNNLLTGILGSLALMRSSIAPADPLLENLGLAETAARQAAVLTKGLLTFSRSAVVLPVPMNTTAAIDATLAMLKPSLPATVNIVRDYERTVWNVLMDQSQVTQILFNLAVNARDAMKGKGTLTIRRRNEVVEEEYVQAHPSARAGEFVHLSVTDTGSGMSAEVMRHLFEPFFTTKPAGSGTGLGLSIVRGAVEQAGGWITVVSTEGVGTTFDIYLPRCLEEPKDSLAPNPILTHPASETVLVVEDELVVCAVAQTILRKNGYRALTAPDGASALNALREHPTDIDLILLDMTMPGMTTDEVVQAIRTLNSTLRILLTSGYASGDTVNRMIEEGSVQGFLAKPYTLAELVGKVQEVLQRS